MNSLLYSLVTIAGLLGKAGDLNIPDKSTVDIAGILGVVYMIAGVVAVIVIIVASISYSTAAGDAGKMARAKSAILYGLIGIVVVGIAFPITIYVAGLIK